MVFDGYTKQRILSFFDGQRPTQIQHLLEEKGIAVSRQGMAKFIRRYLATGTIAWRKRSGRRCNISDDVKGIVEEEMRRDDETTASQLHVILTRKGYHLNLATILRCQTMLGWVYRGSTYCQVIREANKLKRLEWARKNQGDRFDNVVFTDKCTIQMESHCRFCYYGFRLEATIQREYTHNYNDSWYYLWMDCVKLWIQLTRHALTLACFLVARPIFY